MILPVKAETMKTSLKYCHPLSPESCFLKGFPEMINLPSIWLCVSCLVKSNSFLFDFKAST